MTFRRSKRGTVPLALFLGLALALGAPAQNARERPTGWTAGQAAGVGGRSMLVPGLLRMPELAQGAAERSLAASLLEPAVREVHGD